MEESETNHRHPRLVLHNFLSIDECKELEFIHKSNSTVGYRPHVFSTTLSHLIATNSPHFMVPFVPIRERLKEKVEEFFGCEFELFVEFTGLISWTRGANIGWHSDDNRPYLKQRDFAVCVEQPVAWMLCCFVHFTVSLMRHSPLYVKNRLASADVFVALFGEKAVCYLNSYGKDFKGGLFHFYDGEPATVVPIAGDVIIYTADSRNIHSVDEIIEGERLTLTLWFSRDVAHDEDAKLISLLSELLSPSSDNVLCPMFPRPASSNMYWFSPDPVADEELGFDICCARMHTLGLDVYSCQEKGSASDFTELLLVPLQVAKGSELFEEKFVNILHALQVLQFFDWKVAEFGAYELVPETTKVVQLSKSQMEEINAMKSVLLKDHIAAEKIFGCVTSNKNWQHAFDWAKFSSAVVKLEEYISVLYKVLVTSLQHWKTQNMIYSVPVEGI